MLGDHHSILAITLRCVAVLVATAYFAVLLVRSAEAAEPSYTLPFHDTYYITSEGCFGCYPGHEGTDYVIGGSGAGDEVAAAAGATAKPCLFDDTAGYSIVLDHGAGHRTRYLHLNQYALPDPGDPVQRGELIGYEGSTGYTDPPGFVHLHFETRINATTFTCGRDGTAVNPYNSSAYLWSTNPPTYYRGTETVGIFRWSPLEWRLTNHHTNPVTNYYNPVYGQNGDIPVAGDWDGDGCDSIGVFRPSEAKWYLNNNLDSGPSDYTLSYGISTDLPVVGDWNGSSAP